MVLTPIIVTSVIVLVGLWLLYKNQGKTLPTGRRHRYNSFAKERKNSQAKWFVDGEHYMSAVADALKSAKKEILITDWQMNPYIFMKRPATGVVSLEWRLDKMLFEKADEGVRVYILLYWETRGTMNLGSTETEKVLKSHVNIEVHRHPNWPICVSHPTAIRWSHHEKMVIVDRRVVFVGGIDLCFGRWDTHSHELMDNYPTHPCIKEEKKHVERSQETNARYSRWIGKDYRNAFLNNESETDWEKPFNDYEGFDRNQTPRMPWHDVACGFTGTAVDDAVEHFTHRYNHQNPSAKMEFSKFDRLPAEEIIYSALSPSHDNLTIQVLRSVNDWSAGQPHEESILNAYLDVIKNAKHFIYIENQFFISSQPAGSTVVEVKNEIQSALAERIIRAKNQSDDFHVMIIMPLKPEFGPENWKSGRTPCLNSVTYWNNATLANGEHSLLQKLKGQMSDKEVKRYFSVYGLRTYGRLGGTNVETEIIYVHSKLMIVDDRITIIGSANINDRSMLGGRDSEIAVIVEDVDGESHRMGKFSYCLRCHLLNEHLGQLNMADNAPDALNIKEPLATAFLEEMSERAENNTKMFEKIFPGSRTLPTNQVRSYEELDKWKTHVRLAETKPSSAEKELRKIKGRIVIFPFSFLKEELTPSLVARVRMETYAPENA